MHIFSEGLAPQVTGGLMPHLTKGLTYILTEGFMLYVTEGLTPHLTVLCELGPVPKRGLDVTCDRELYA